MKASKFSDTQKAFILKQGADGFPVARTSQATDFKWKKKYDGLLPTRERAQGADLVAQSRWRHQPAIVKRPGNSTFRRSREWDRSNVSENTGSGGGAEQPENRLKPVHAA